MATEKEYYDALEALTKVWKADRGDDANDNFGDGYSFAYKMAIIALIDRIMPGTLDRLNKEATEKKQEKQRAVIESMLKARTKRQVGRPRKT